MAKRIDWSKVDEMTEALMVIDYAHHEVHEGNFFRSGMNYSLSNGDIATLGITTPDSEEWAHMTWELSATADGTFQVIENVTSFSGGASVAAINHNRNSANTSALTLIKGMTGDNLITPTGGSVIMGAVLGTGKGSVISRGTGQEFILKSNTKYLFRYTNGTSVNIIQLVLDWYEHTGVN